MEGDDVKEEEDVENICCRGGGKLRMMLRRRTDPKTETHTLHKPA